MLESVVQLLSKLVTRSPAARFLNNKARDPVVRVVQGQLQGAVLQAVDDSTYYSFKGIPYAEPPVGELRFRAPRPKKPWSFVRKATEHGPICTQYDLNLNKILVGSEDCLYLNVYTRSLDYNAKIPVMVYIHGGAFMTGSGNSDTYGPEFLIQHDVILVTINYRLEVLGFLSLDTPEVPGNAGMKDQVQALRWVKENIEKFGGDPNNVTIFGESSGSAAITYLMLSPMAKGLFHKAIAQSGVCLHDWAFTSNAKERAFSVAKVLGRETKNTEELLQFLRSVPAVNLTKLTKLTRTADERYRGFQMHFVPSVEKSFHNVEPFLTKTPIDLLLSHKECKVPLMIGYNSAEGIQLLENQLKMAEIYNDKPSYFVPRELLPNLTEKQLKDFGNRILKFYTGEKGMANETAQGIIDMITDVLFAYNTHRFAHFYNSINAPVYMYRFDYSTKLNMLKSILGAMDRPGACHADDLYYLFCGDLNKDIYLSKETLKKIVFDLTKLWTDFAKTGNPTPVGSTIKWSQYTAAGREYLALNEMMTPSSRAEQDRMDMWNMLYCEASVPYITECETLRKRQKITL